jgi:hypothetical protein
VSERPRRRWARLLVLVVAAVSSLGWSAKTIRHVAWSAVEFFPPDLEHQVRRNHRRFDAGIERGLGQPPSWRAAAPGKLPEALEYQAMVCADGLRQPIPLEDLVEELGVLAVSVLDANDPLAVGHDDQREPLYAAAYGAYVDAALARVRLVYYGEDSELVRRRLVAPTVARSLARSREMYPFVGAEFFRTGSLRDWRSFDDLSVAFGVAAVCLSRAMTDVANFGAYVWEQGGGLVPTPLPTPQGHVGPTVQLALGGGFPDRGSRARGAPAMPSPGLILPPP